jgi:5'-3' exoribonuclease 1
MFCLEPTHEKTRKPPRRIFVCVSTEHKNPASAVDEQHEKCLTPTVVDMGIPFFFAALVRQYPHIVTSVIPKRVTSLYVDLNCIIHKAVNDAMALPTIESSPTIIEQAICKGTVDYVHGLIDLVQNPSLKRVYLAIDGVPPRAKMVQQRKRRYLADATSASHHSNAWDRNAVTPGTRFMQDLEAWLRNAFRDRSEIVLSDSNEEGEGEMKIMTHIRQNHQANPQREPVAIYGLDADLIMLSLLASDIVDTYIVRDAQPSPSRGGGSSNTNYMLVNVEQLKRHISIPYEDYVVLCMLLGNDFIPPLTFLKVSEPMIGMLVGIYKKVKADTSTPLVTNGSVNMSFLIKLIGEIRELEDEQMIRTDKMYFDRRPVQDTFRRVICPSAPGWRQRWYYHLFHKMTEPRDIHDVCLSYIQGILWCYQYYTSWVNRPSRLWYYKYNYSPTALDLCNSFASAGVTCDAVQSQECTVDWTPTLQCLMVLPPASLRNLVSDEAVLQIVTNKELGMTHIYPTGFQKQTYLKTHEWEHCPVLPDIDIRRLTTAMCSQLNKKSQAIDIL